MTSDWDREAFRKAYVSTGGSPSSANSYVSYLNRAERVLGGLSAHHAGLEGRALVDRASQLPAASWGGERNRRDSMSALRRFVDLAQPQPSFVSEAAPVMQSASHHDVMALLREAQSIGARYYQATGKPLGVTGEVAEFEAAEKLRLTLCDAGTPWYDAIDTATGSKVQIKGRAIDRNDRYRGMCPAIKCSEAFDEVVLVLLDRMTLEALEIWRVPVTKVAERVDGLLSPRRRSNGTLAITQFKSIAQKVWP